MLMLQMTLLWGACVEPRLRRIESVLHQRLEIWLLPVPWGWGRGVGYMCRISSWG